jgi:two-component system response regulator FixJ
LCSAPLIAVVDDDEAMREALCELVQTFSMSCRTFDSAEAFLRARSFGGFDCVITDLRMPHMGGLELLRTLRSSGSSIPVIVVTSSSDAPTRSRALAEGAFAYLTKPVTRDALLQHLTAALGLAPPE